MPPDNILYKLVDRLEAQLPRDDHVKYDSRYAELLFQKVIAIKSHICVNIQTNIFLILYKFQRKENRLEKSIMGWRA